MAAAPDDDRYDLDILKHIEELSEDVKQGDFVVHTINDGKLESFIIKLDYLAHPGFITLVEKAE